MNTLHAPALPVKPIRSPFRPVKSVDSISWSDFGYRPEVTIHRGNLKQTYHVIPISTDIGGAAFRLHKLGTPTTYDLLINGTESSCTCPGFEYTDGCRHLTAVQMLLEDGTLSVAPGSAAGDEECLDGEGESF
jgi:SWIM zinc finger